MEGTWGRRIYGEVRKIDDRTLFTLFMNLREGRSIQVSAFGNNEDLERYSNLYGLILDRLTQQLQQRLNHTQGAQP